MLDSISYVSGQQALKVDLYISNSLIYRSDTCQKQPCLALAVDVQSLTASE